jgi:BirA family biotin operon repressor/biotin-[acetyl-CoA-carboxylase] ligase
VRVETEGTGPDRVLVGHALGVDPTGRLLVESGGSVHAISAGDCTHLRERSAAP